MDKRPLGQSGLDVTVLTMGCWQAGGTQWTDQNDQDSIAAIRAAYDAGINFFDTAEGYGGGHSERIVAKALEGIRDEVYIATKVGPHLLSTAKLRSACEGSLERLATDHIDLYQIHWPSGVWGSPVVPFEETLAELVNLRTEGKIRAIGVSNFNKEQIAAASEFGRIDSLQPPYSLLFQPYVQDGTIAYCDEHNIGVIPYSPLAQGILTGKFSLETRPGKGDNRSGNVLFQGATYELALEAVEHLRPFAAKYKASLGQLSLAWLLAQPGVTSVIVGARTSEQVLGNIAAATIALEAEDVEAIGRVAAPVLASLPENKTNPWA